MIAWPLCLDRSPTKPNPPKSCRTPLRWMEYVNFGSERLVYVLLPPRSAWNSESWEATEHLHTEVSVPEGSALTPPPLLFHALRNARQTSARVGVHGDSDINKAASNTVQILPVTLHLLPVAPSAAARESTFSLSCHKRCFNEGLLKWTCTRICTTCFLAGGRTKSAWHIYLYIFRIGILKDPRAGGVPQRCDW